MVKCVLNHAEFSCVDMSDLNLSKPCCLSTWNVCMVNCFALWDLQQYVTPLLLHIVRTLFTLPFFLSQCVSLIDSSCFFHEYFSQCHSFHLCLDFIACVISLFLPFTCLPLFLLHPPYYNPSHLHNMI